MSGARTTASATGQGGWRTLLAATPEQVAAYAALLLAVVYLAAGITYVLLPAPQDDTAAILFSAGSSPGWYQLFYGELALSGILGLAVVTPVTALLVGEGNGWTAWAARLAYLGFAVTAVQGVRLAAIIPDLGQLYQGCHTCTGSLGEQQTIAKWLYATLPLDPQNWIAFGALAIWVVAISSTGLRAGRAPALLLRVGLALAVVYAALVIGSAWGIGQLITVAGVLGGVVLGPIWYAWVGMRLRAGEG